MSRRKVAELDTPFSSVEWPSISQEDQDAILQLLCTLLAPLGQHRHDHTRPSQGKRSRRRQKKPAAEPGIAPSAQPEPAASRDDRPPTPELAAYVDAGLSNITRVLAESASPTARAASPEGGPPYAAVFVARSGHPSAFYAHFPQMVAAASGSGSTGLPSSEPIRLVGFSRACEEKLSASLGIPRVSSVALRAGAPQSQGLVDYLREHVQPIAVPWLDEAVAGEHRPTQIHMADVSIGPKRKKR